MKILNKLSLSVLALGAVTMPLASCGWFSNNNEEQLKIDASKYFEVHKTTMLAEALAEADILKNEAQAASLVERLWQSKLGIQNGEYFNIRYKGGKPIGSDLLDWEHPYSNFEVTLTNLEGAGLNGIITQDYKVKNTLEKEHNMNVEFRDDNAIFKTTITTKILLLVRNKDTNHNYGTVYSTLIFDKNYQKVVPITNLI